MSSALTADNAYMYGGADGNPVTVTPGGNVATTTIFDSVKNVGKKVLRVNQVFRLPDCPCTQIHIFAWANNRGNIWVAGYNDQAPQIGAGLPIVPGAKFEPYCTNSNLFSIVADEDDDTASILIDAVSLANNVNIEPSNDPSVDTTIPVVVSNVPATNGTFLSRDTPISFATNVPIDPATVNLTNINTFPTIPSLSVTVDSGNPYNILLLYTGDLASTTQYTVAVQNLASMTGFVMASAYTWNFTTSNSTSPPDFTPPTLVSFSPLSNATNVLTTVNPTFTFDKPILPASITNTSIELTDVDSTSFVSGVTFSQSTDQKTVTMIPPTLSPGTNYRIDIWNTNSAGNGIQDNVLVYLDNTYSIPFQTKQAYTIFYNVAGNGNYANIGLYEGAAFIAGELIQSGSTLVGQVPLYFVFTVRSVHSLTLSGTVSFKWRRNENTNGVAPSDFKILGTVAASAVPTTDTQYTFNIPTNTDALQVGDFICIEWESGNSTNHLVTPFSSTGVFGGTTAYYFEYIYHASGTTFTSLTGADYAMTIGVAN